MADQTGAVDLEGLALDLISAYQFGSLTRDLVDDVVAALERIPKLEREIKDLTLARNAAKFWRERAERVEAAARPFERCTYGYRTWCGNCPGCRLHIARAPAPGDVGKP